MLHFKTHGSLPSCKIDDLREKGKKVLLWSHRRMCANNCLLKWTRSFVECTASPSLPHPLPSSLMPEENTCISTFFLTVESITSFSHLIYDFRILADLVVVLEGYSNKGKVSALPLFPISLHWFPGFLRKDSREGVWVFNCNCKNKTNK